jgi:hypothetical protein
MKRLLMAVGIATSIFSLVPGASAGPNDAVQIAIYPGHGTTLNFRSTGETVRRAWLDDPSKVTLDFDDVNCQIAVAKQACAAQVIHLRRINALHFPGLPATATTALTVMTDRNLYPFRLVFPATGLPQSAIVNVQTNSQDSQKRSGTTFLSFQGMSSTVLIARGLDAAVSQNLLAQGDALWNRVKSLLQLTQSGVPIRQAAQQVGVSQELLQRLAKLGQTSTL